MQLSPLPIPRKATRSPGCKERPILGQGGRQRQRDRAHVSQVGEGGEIFGLGDAQRFQDRLSMREPTWWQITLSTWSADPAETPREVPPGLLAQLDAVGEHRRRVGRR